ncbi:enoyl-CoA hydratase/isomerase family protein [Streptomyces sp. NPDC001165]|uniref:enoyl-CoA hydratase/isomerase family protein n=1 Tax=Streptomyces sp. NPDC001165 TaxID=3364546 RepID=UPI0036C5A1DA
MSNDVLDDLKTLLVKIEPPILTVQLNTPESGNSLSGLLLGELLTVLNRAEEDPEIRIVVLAGSGDDFCQGGDRSEFRPLLADDPSGSAFKTLAHKALQVCNALMTAKTVTIARLHGSVIGAGVGLAVLCDLRVGADNTRFRLPEGRLGVPPAWGGILPHLLSQAGPAVVEPLLTGRNFDAKTGMRMGILHNVVSPDELDAAVTDWTKDIRRMPPPTLRATKTMLNAYRKTTRLADGGFFDEEILMSSIMAQELTRRR